MDRVNIRTLAEGILGLGILEFGKHERQKTLNSKKIRVQDIKEEESEKLEDNDFSAQALFKHGRVANLDSYPNPLEMFNFSPDKRDSKS